MSVATASLLMFGISSGNYVKYYLESQKCAIVRAVHEYQCGIPKKTPIEGHTQREGCLAMSAGNLPAKQGHLDQLELKKYVNFRSLK